MILETLYPSHVVSERRSRKGLGIYPPGSKSKALRIGVHLIFLYFIRISLSIPKTFFHPESKSKALRLEVHLVLLYFIGMTISTPKTFFFILVVEGNPLSFWFFESLDNNMVYSFGIYVYICQIYLCKLIFLALDGGWWCPSFWFAKPLHKNMVDTLGIDGFVFGDNDGQSFSSNLKVFFHNMGCLNKLVLIPFKLGGNYTKAFLGSRCAALFFSLL